VRTLAEDHRRRAVDSLACPLSFGLLAL
jgi:hypothetical protein